MNHIVISSLFCKKGKIWLFLLAEKWIFYLCFVKSRQWCSGKVPALAVADKTPCLLPRMQSSSDL